MVFTKEKIMNHVGQASFTRGKTYYRGGRVSNLRLEKRTVSGHVRGSEWRPYRTFFFLTPDNDIDSECSCPVGYACKHVAALGLAALVQYAGGIDKPLYISNNERITSGKRVLENSSENKKQDVRYAQVKKKHEQPWETLFAQARREERDEPFIENERKAEVQLFFRVAEKPAPYSSGYGPYSFRQKKGSGIWHLEIRPRVYYPWAESISLTDLTWKQARSPYAQAPFAVSRTAFLFLRQLAFALVEDDYSQSQATWLTIPGSAADYAWHLLQQAHLFGITLQSGQKGEHEVAVVLEPITYALVLTDAKEGIQAEKKFFHHDHELPESRVLLVGDPPAFAAILGDTISEQANNVPFSLHALAFTEKKEKNPHAWQSIQVPYAQARRFQTEYLPGLMHLYPVKNNSSHIVAPVKRSPSLSVDITNTGKQSIAVRLSFQYEDKKYLFGQAPSYISSADGAGILTDREKEAALRKKVEAILTSLVFAWADDLSGLSGRSLRDAFFLTGIEAARFMAETVPLLERETDVKVTVNKKAPHFIHDTSQPVVAFSVEKHQEEDSHTHDWFDLDIMVRVGGEDVPFTVLFAALHADEQYLLLPSGRYFSLAHSVFDSLRVLIKEARSIHETTKDGVVVSRFQAGFWKELQALGVVEKQAREWKRAMDGLFSIERITVSQMPAAIRAKLRPYQRDGFRWLSFLYDNKLGGVLGDDMGLGKTIQAIALMVKARERRVSSRKRNPFLVVAPTSVVENWDSELDRFAPHLARVIMRRGKREEQLKAIPSADVAVTSYALLLRDFERLRTQSYDAIIFDEAQFAKNYQSKVYAAARKLATGCRIALTGTPMENNLMELWTLFSLVTPGLFGSPEHFRDEFQRPIEKGENSAILKRLQSRIRPFFLRRTKDLVASELPPKTEYVIKIDMHQKHRHFYTLHLQRERQKVLGLLEQGGLKQNRFRILSSLTKMRQLALHAVLVDAHKGIRIPSSKLDALEERVSSLVKGGHRALIFSQFTSLLSLVKKRFDARMFPYLYLDGSTTRRDALIKKFQEGAVPLFLISLKAGGLGINLTAADYCIMLDPWWNPAVENQAVDRAHRIGQTKNVFVYKLIAKDTIEEKVLALQEKKKHLFKSVIDDEAHFASMITEEDIRNLFT